MPCFDVNTEQWTLALVIVVQRMTVWQCDSRRWQQFLCSNHCNSVCRLPGEVMDHQVQLCCCSWFSENPNNPPAKKGTLLLLLLLSTATTYVGRKCCHFCWRGNSFVRISPALSQAWHWHDMIDNLTFSVLAISVTAPLLVGPVTAPCETETDLSSRKIINPPAEAWIVHLIFRPHPVSGVWSAMFSNEIHCSPPAQCKGRRKNSNETCHLLQPFWKFWWLQIQIFQIRGELNISMSLGPLPQISIWQQLSVGVVTTTPSLV